MKPEDILPAARPLSAQIHALLSGGDSEVALMALSLALAQCIHLVRAPERRAATCRLACLMVGHELQALEFSEGAAIHAAA